MKQPAFGVRRKAFRDVVHTAGIRHSAQSIRRYRPWKRCFFVFNLAFVFRNGSLTASPLTTP